MTLERYTFKTTQQNKREKKAIIAIFFYNKKEIDHKRIMYKSFEYNVTFSNVYTNYVYKRKGV